MPLRTVLFCNQKVAQARPAWAGWAVISVTSAIAAPADLQEGWAHILRLAFDDMPEIFSFGHPNLYVVAGEHGLTDADVLAIIGRIK